MATTIRLVSNKYTHCSPTHWPQLAFATNQCWLGINDPLGTIENLTNCKMVQEMNNLGVPYNVVDHVGNSFDILVPYDNAAKFTPLKQCQECIYNKTK